jgi:hypothetical protein
MRDLNLGPDSQKLIDAFRALDRDQRVIAAKADELYMSAIGMARMLERWIEVAWCWPDACPARICKGPHVRVRYENSKTIEVIEPIDRVGETFPGDKFTIIR